MVRVLRATQSELDAAVQALRDGELVAFPTETVYGLGAHAGHPVALRRVFDLKGRPLSHPLIVHLDSVRYLGRWAREIPPAAEQLAASFWPGPLTLVLPRAYNVHPLVTGGQDTVAVRVPAHPMAQQLLTAFGGGIAAPSANRYRHLSPTRAEHVREEFGDAVRVVLDGGDCKIGLESTIIACLDGCVRLLRPGAIGLSQLRSVVGAVLTGSSAESPRVPGSNGAHYAPQTPLSIASTEEVEQLASDLSAQGHRVAVLALRPPLRTHPFVTWINAGMRPDAYAHDLYANLRALDRSACTRILVQAVPDDERWDAVRDRLSRAAAASETEIAADDDSPAVNVLP
ncbi:MAG TPA: L-threonylcarbamoyladenylate synthase [Steroidobacteraceae bacterium]|jgi:L-threonylcarbamoyladenylate synthase|nr:L-threonylcarbamoyladenylate synthase [Steroidobacteraceae bacterium]